MSSSRADIVLHPVRLRIIIALAGQRMSPQQIAAALPDVPQASLYRHINKLCTAGVLTVVAENPVRGVVEKVYALPEEGEVLPYSELATASREDHMRYFTTFVALLLHQYQRYLQGETIDLKADGVMYRTSPLYLSDEEYAQLLAKLKADLQKVERNGPAPNRRRRLIATIVIPEKEN